jgi:hypothetical protein
MLRAISALLLFGFPSLICSADSSGATGAPGGFSSAWSGSTKTVTPKETLKLLANPGMGWQTFHSYANEDSELRGLPSGSAYFRFSWRELEASDGAIDTSILSNALSKARAAGQTLMFRVMTAGDTDEYVPNWLEGAGCKVFRFSAPGHNRSNTEQTLIAPDLDDVTCWRRFETLMTKISRAVGNELDLQIDIGGVGLWGEWHFSGTIPEVPMPSLATRRKVVDLHLKLFPNSPATALINDVGQLSYAISNGAGWRADCFGDYGIFSSAWNHMDNMYMQHLTQAGAENAWRKAPVAWETCGTMQDWVGKGFDIRRIFQYGLDLHGSFINNKGAKIPEGAPHRVEVEAALLKLGYRLVLRSLSHESSVKLGGPLAINAIWDNVGVAPPYHSFQLQVRLSPVDGCAEPVVLTSGADVRTWLPGQHQVADTFQLPSTLTPGNWRLSVGVTGTPGVPMLRLAIEGRDAEGWYPVSEFEVK